MKIERMMRLEQYFGLIIKMKLRNVNEIMIQENVSYDKAVEIYADECSNAYERAKDKMEEKRKCKI